MRFALPIFVFLIGAGMALSTAQSVFAPRGGDVGEPWGQAIFPMGLGLCLLGVLWLVWVWMKRR